MSYWRYAYWRGDVLGPVAVYERVLDSDDLAKLDALAPSDYTRMIDGPFATEDDAIGPEVKAIMEARLKEIAIINAVLSDD